MVNFNVKDISTRKFVDGVSTVLYLQMINKTKSIKKKKSKITVNDAMRFERF